MTDDLFDSDMLPTIREIRDDLNELPEGQRRGLMAEAQRRCDEHYTSVPWVPRVWVEQVAWRLLQRLKQPRWAE